jgi:alkylation response protein AidB-like acyl-CoA dehydrogenase
MSKRLEFREDYGQLLEPAMRKLFVDIGLQKMQWPEKHGGAGQNNPDIALPLILALEQVGRGDTGIGFLFAVTFALSTTFTMEKNYRESLCARFAPLFCDSHRAIIGSLALPVYDGTGDSHHPSFQGKALQATARIEGGEWVVDGQNVRPINSGGNAVLFGILCYIEGEEEPALLLVPGDAPGLSRGEVFLKTGLAASLNAELNLRRVRVPEDHLVFRGDVPYREMLAWLYLGTGAVTVGSLFATHEIISKWGEERVIKGRGQIFKENPLTASLMAEIANELLISRLLVHQLAQMFAQPEVYGEPGEERVFVPALCILTQVTHAAEKAINYAMELMGSAGYAKEWNLERYWRDIKTLQVHLGNRELNKMEMARYFYQCRTL